MVINVNGTCISSMKNAVSVAVSPFAHTTESGFNGNVKSFFEQGDNQRELFLMKDIHLTSEGHRVVASSIVDHFASD